MTADFVHSARKPSIVGALALCAVLTAGGTLEATPLFPGGSAVPSPYAAADTLVSAVVTAPFTSGSFTGTVVTAVFADALSGLMNFYYQVFNSTSSSAGITRTTHTDFFDTTFGTYATDVNFRTDAPAAGFVAGGQTPVLADRNAAGETVGFFFFTGTSGMAIPAAAHSDVLVIKTDAPSFSLTGSTNLIDGSVASVTTFEPTGSPVPEPGSIFMLGTGLLGLAALARRRFQRRA